MKLDEQSHKLIELKQKFTYFIITAAMAVIVFAGKFLIDYGKSNMEALALTGAVITLICAATAGLAASAAALVSVHKGHAAYKLALDARHRRTDHFSEDEKSAIKSEKKLQENLLRIAIALLTLEMFLSISFFAWALY